MQRNRLSKGSLANVAASGLVAVSACVALADDQDSTALKWTPHRAAIAGTAGSGTLGGDAASRPVADAPALDSMTAVGVDRPGASPPPLGPPVSVTLPADVPAPPGAPRVDRYAPLRRGVVPPPSWTMNGRGPSSATVFPPMSSLLGRDFTRAPQDVRRQSPPGMSSARNDRARRPERFAMNADGIPSVMSRAQLPPAVDRTYPNDGGGSEIISMPGMGGMDMSGMGMGSGMGMTDDMLSDPGFGSEYRGESFGGGMFADGPTYMHVESFFDDPYACEDEECLLPVWEQHGRICNWMRQFGRPYYGWKWYRDLTASAGVMSFTNITDLGINGNYGTNEYLNWAMPFWNAFGVGWQVGARATQSNFHPTVLNTPGGSLQTNARNQVFVTTGFFTRAFEGRGLQGGAVYDYLNDSWFDNVDVAQLRAELSYVWGYHELGFWGAFNIGEEQGLFGPVTRSTAETSTLDIYAAFYRLQFGDANEWKFYGGGTGQGDGIIGSFVRAPMSNFWALEGTFTYVIPGQTRVIDIDGQGTSLRVSPDAWNVGVNVVFYPAGRSRRILASPYRPLFEVADNGSMIRTIGP